MTFTAVARCPETGQFGIATQSHWPFSGSSVIWAQAGVGVVATQANSEPSYGPRGLQLLDSGVPCKAALGSLLTLDAAPALRQVAMLGADGTSAYWSGADCIDVIGTEEREGALFIGNLLANDEVVPAMAAAWDDGKGETLGWRLLRCLEAAQAAGGDLRGQQSAALKVVDGQRTQPWEGIIADIRIDDDPRPLERLRHLLNVREAYNHARLGDIAAAQERVSDAITHYDDAQALLPQSAELALWRGVLLANNDQREAARAAFAISEADGPGWRVLIERMVENGRLPTDWFS